MKNIIFLLLLFVTLSSVAFSGCLDGGGEDQNITDSTGNISAPTQNNSSDSNATVIAEFNASIVTVNPLPSGFTHLATRSVVANTQGIGVSNAFIGYRNMLTYEDSNVYLSVYRCSPSKSASDCISEMTVWHKERYGNDSQVSTVSVNGHNATLLEATVNETPQTGRYLLVWSNWSGDMYEDSYLVVVNGQVNYSVLQTLAEASNL